MEQGRRRFLRSSGGLIGALVAAGFIGIDEVRAEAWNAAAFESKDLDQLIRNLGGSGAKATDAIEIVAPDIAENGAVVPIGVASKVEATEAIAIVVERNPNPLAALFTIPPGTLPALQTRVKMAETCNVVVLIKAAGEFQYAAKEIKVTIGGCGG
ncbi:MAG TPA: thiosulfate oxidation carrier protein SoxY [Burkholderiales bacterium]|nr:thiosulfate oxidation carrier protein SoxY [Burkholderiales bacterium]